LNGLKWNLFLFFEETAMTTSSNASSYLAGRRPLSKGLNITCWALQVLAALAFLGAGGSKLAGAPVMVALFAKIGAGQWFRYLTGSLEVIGAIGLLVPRANFYGALVLVCVMVGAIVFHLTVLGGNPIPPAVLLVIVGSVAWLRRPMAG
jgi:putative oxidoreductase